METSHHMFTIFFQAMFPMFDQAILGFQNRRAAPGDFERLHGDHQPLLGLQCWHQDGAQILFRNIPLEMLMR